MSYDTKIIFLTLMVPWSQGVEFVFPPGTLASSYSPKTSKLEDFGGCKFSLDVQVSNVPMSAMLQHPHPPTANVTMHRQDFFFTLL